ncbi:MAG: ATP-binding protein [Chloroflexi bacterium]|nr:ATP-binding protein [Chloroflexota bacterium]
MTPLLGREAELRAAFSRLASGQSAAIVGEPDTGKSLLLAQLARAEVRAEWLPHPERLAVFALDGRHLPAYFIATTFWQSVFGKLCVEAPPAIRVEAKQFVAMGDYGAFALERFFRQMGRSGLRVVLLVDHFGHFLSHLLAPPAASAGELLGALRSLSSRSGGLSLIVASHRRVSELNQQTAKLNPRGSPYFNTLQEIRLGAFGTDEARKILGSQVEAPLVDAVLAAVGRHPHLLSLALNLHPIPADAQSIVNALSHRAGEHFDLAFSSLSNLAPVLLSAVGYKTLPRPPALGDIEDLIWRGWLDRNSDGTLRPDSLLLAQWLENKHAELV